MMLYIGTGTVDVGVRKVGDKFEGVCYYEGKTYTGSACGRRALARELSDKILKDKRAAEAEVKMQTRLERWNAGGFKNS